MNRIEIPLSKSSIILVFIGAIAFVVAGILFLVTPETFISPILRNLLTVRVVGVAAILFFGAVGVYAFRKLSDTTAGLVLDEYGITDNTNASSTGLIEWADIKGIEVAQVMSTKFLLIFVSDPDKYLARVSGFKRKLLQGNLKMYGTPLAITSTILNYDIEALEKLIRTMLAEQESNQESV